MTEQEKEKLKKKAPKNCIYCNAQDSEPHTYYGILYGDVRLHYCSSRPITWDMMSEVYSCGEAREKRFHLHADPVS